MHQQLRLRGLRLRRLEQGQEAHAATPLHPVVRGCSRGGPLRAPLAPPQQQQSRPSSSSSQPSPSVLGTHLTPCS